jgi:hypothetical protein
MKRVHLPSLLLLIAVFSPLPEANATTYVKVTVTITDEADNLPTGNSIAEARGESGSFSTQASLKNNSFTLDVPQGLDLNLRLFVIFESVETFNSNAFANQSKRKVVPNIDITTNKSMRFDRDTELKIRFGAPKIISLNITDAQLNPVKNVISEPAWVTNQILLNGLGWTLLQRQSLSPWWVFSTDGNFELAYYDFEDTRIQFNYWENGASPPPSTNGPKGVTLRFKFSEFKNINLCLPINFDASRVTNKNCFENVFKNAEAEAKAAAELKAKQEAEAKAAAEFKAKQEAEAKAAAELKAKQEAEAKAKAAKKKVTITCVKGKTVKKVTAVKPKCPAGYKKK